MRTTQDLGPCDVKARAAAPGVQGGVNNCLERVVRSGQRLGDDGYVISADEKSQLQALRRLYPDLPPGPTVSVAEASEALADPDALLFDPDPKSASRQSARLLGYSPTATAVLAVLAVIRVRREERPGAWWGANAWRANSTDRQTYREGNQP